MGYAMSLGFVNGSRCVFLRVRDENISDPTWCLYIGIGQVDLRMGQLGILYTLRFGGREVEVPCGNLYRGLEDIIPSLHRCTCLCLHWPRQQVMDGGFDWPIIPRDAEDENNVIPPTRSLYVGIDCNWEVELREVAQQGMDILTVHRMVYHMLVIGCREVEIPPYNGGEVNLTVVASA